MFEYNLCTRTQGVTANENTASNKYSILIGRCLSVCIQFVLKMFLWSWGQCDFSTHIQQTVSIAMCTIYKVFCLHDFWAWDVHSYQKVLRPRYRIWQPQMFQFYCSVQMKGMTLNVFSTFLILSSLLNFKLRQY